MSTFESTFKTILCRFLRDACGVDCLKVLTYSQEDRSGGYCESCYYEEVVVEVSYLDGNGHPATYTIYETMSELIESLIAFDRRTPA